MTDTASPGTRAFDKESDAARARVRKRYRAEARFRAYGIAAVAFAALFLVALISDVIVRAVPAFTTSWLSIEVQVNPADVDPKGDKTPASLTTGNYDTPIRNALALLLPGANDRVSRRQLAGLVSSNGSEDFRDQVLREPDLVGKTIKTRVLLSDDADLFIKGHMTRIEEIGGQGELTPSGTEGTITLSGAPALSATNFTSAAPSTFVRINGGWVKVTAAANGQITGDVFMPLSGTNPGKWKLVTFDVPEGSRRVTDREVVWLHSLNEQGLIERTFNWRFFTSGDSREAELAGILGALSGSLFTMLITLVLCLPTGVAAAIYLEEFAPKNRWTDLIEVNINNLAAVPSIIFGLLGLAVFLNFVGLPRSTPLVGGLVLALLVLPTIIIASRAALAAVPPSIREGALGVGASHQQAIFHHVLPLAMPGILTGTIIGMAHALGETAPLLLIGMVAFIVDVPTSATDAATALPVQIFLWSDLPEAAFKAKTAGAIIVLLMFLFVMNGLAIFLRRRFERRW
jgi:phosphate transport system permease protein